MGKAIEYMLKRWERFTLFLRVPNAPIDNNICERALKMAIRHRRNSLFYKTERGAWVGDLFMSLIHTCNLMAVNAFEYLTTLLRNAAKLAQDPSRWMPWNYKEALSTNPP
jgi:transposase